MLEISAVTARRYVMGRQGMWPGRRWQGLEGAATAMRTMEHLQLDPLVVVARAHDLMLASRVVDYAIDDWARLTYEQRRFFEWGGWLAVRPMDELPFWRVLMRREAGEGNDGPDRARAPGRRGGDAHHPPVGARGVQPGLRDAGPDARRQLPGPQGQRPCPPLPVAYRRGNGEPARSVRAGVRGDGGGRANRRRCAKSPRTRQTTCCCARRSRRAGSPGSPGSTGS